MNDNIDQIITIAQMISGKYCIPMTVHNSPWANECTIQFNRKGDVFSVQITDITVQDTVVAEILNHYCLTNFQEKAEKKEIKLDEDTVVSIGINELKQLINSAVNSAIDKRFGV